jgi:hypothetical protein
MKENYETFKISGNGYFCINCHAPILTTTYYPCSNCGITDEEVMKTDWSQKRKTTMTDYPYSQQIHDKILADWQNVPFSEWKFGGYEVSHPSVNYSLGWSLDFIRPYDSDLSKALSVEHARSLHEQLVNKAKETSDKEKSEFAAKQFLGLE